MDILISTIIGIFGLFIGSFLNVVIYRMSTGRSIVFGRSHCPSCNKTLTFNELIPVVSFIFQKGRCRGCHTKISSQYPFVELVTGVTFFLITFFSDVHPPVLIWYLLMASLALVISVYDYKHYIIPLKPWGLLTGLAFFGGIFILHLPIFYLLLSGLLCGLPCAFFYGVSKGKWMGFGDALLGVTAGFLLGISGGFASIIIGFWIGAVISILLLLLHRKTFASTIPFGPFLLIGLFLCLLFQINLESIIFGFSRILPL